MLSNGKAFGVINNEALIEQSTGTYRCLINIGALNNTFDYTSKILKGCNCSNDGLT